MSDAMQRLIELLDRTERELPVDPDRLYVTGLSMGGYGSFDLVLRQPNRFAAAVPVCGGVDVQQLPRVKHVPFWLFHGGKDTVVPPERSRDAVAALQAAGATVKYTEYPDVGHDSWNGAYTDREMFRWLFEQRRAAAPAAGEH
jgi:predicted peptidase